MTSTLFVGAAETSREEHTKNAPEINFEKDEDMADIVRFG
jgi:hypothetical protein